MTLTKTGGGRYDPKEGFIYFLAALSQDVLDATPHAYHLLATNDFFTEANVWKLEAQLDRGSKLFLDSGIFWLTQNHARSHNVHMDVALGLHPTEIEGFDKLYPRYCELVHRYEDRLWGYVELDQGGAERKRETRQRLAEKGIHPIPVYHPLNDGWDYFDELAESYDRICIGNVVNANAALRKRIFATMWERRRRYPDLWIHILGYTPTAHITSVPLANSTDSSAWAFAMKFGAPSAPGATSLNHRFGRFGAGYSYKLESEMRDADGYWAGAAFVGSQAHFHQQAWRTHLSDYGGLFGHHWPAYVEDEPPVKAAQ